MSRPVRNKNQNNAAEPFRAGNCTYRRQNIHSKLFISYIDTKLSSPYQRDSTVSQFPESMSYNWAAAGIIYNKLYVDNSSLKCRWGGAEITDYLFVADFVIPDRRNVVIKEYIFDIIVLYQTLNNFLSF